MVTVLYVFPGHPLDALELADANDRQAFELMLLLGKGHKKTIPIAPNLNIHVRTGDGAGLDSNFIFDGVEVFGPAVVARCDDNGTLTNLRAGDVDAFERRCTFSARPANRR